MAKKKVKKASKKAKKAPSKAVSGRKARKRRRTRKIKEIRVGLSGVIPIASFENLRPTFEMVIEPKRGEKPQKVFDYAEGIIHERFDQLANRAKADLIDKQYANIRFREKSGKKYPSVTSILSWDVDWRVSEDELNQYAARGKIIDKLLELYFQMGKWANPLKIPELKEEISILLGGSLNFHWDDCSHEAFIKQFIKKINIQRMKTIVFNDEHLYSGEIDFVGDVEGIHSIIDVKTGVFDMRQLAAYAVCEKDIEALVVFPVGPTDNKCGYMRPVICDTVQDKFREFLDARAKFRERFGI